jgi:hypothetical protein
MKISIALSVLILAAAAGLGWRDHQRLAAVRERHAKLVAEAATLGIALEPSRPAASVRITKRERENKEVEAKLVAVEFIAFAREMEAIEKKGGPPDEAAQKRLMEFMDRMMSLDSSQLKILIAEVRATRDLKDETRQGLIGFSIMTLSNDHPQAALALFTETSDLFKGEGMSEHLVSSSLSRWAKDDPLAALEWVKINGAKFPDLVTDDVKRGLVTGAAANDPKQAFKLIGELGLKETSQAMSGIMRAARTPEERTMAIVALREHLATLPDEKTRNEQFAHSVSGLAGGLAQGGFESATQWIAEAKLSPSELESLASGLGHSAKSGETGQWIDWIGEKLPPDKSADNIRRIVRKWTQNDYQAAGKWLAETPGGPSKNTAIRSYAETISEYEPETAAQWALTLPPGKDREETIRRIHSNWPKDDAAAKEAFAEQHGIK